MGVYIKGMEMPQACLACEFCNPFTEEPYCRRLMKVTPKTTTLPDCPIIEIPEPRWIPVTERLPEKEDEAVIVWEKQGFALIDWRHDNKWAIVDNNFGIATHWLPLPDPPKEET